jgi:hypothetical protein
MMGTLFRIIKPLIQYYATSFLKEDGAESKQTELVKKKVRRASSTGIGKKMGLNSGAQWEELPLTTYSFYRSFFEAPQEGDLLYPISEYFRVYTSGTMGKPKSFLQPREWLKENIRKTALTGIFLFSHDGEKYRVEVGDTIYRNSPGGAFISSFMHGSLDRFSRGFLRQVPEDTLTFKEKVDYFVENYKEIDMAYMNVPILLEEIVPRVGESFHLKGFFTQDRAAPIFKEEIKETVGTYPKVIFGSTETSLSGLPSIEYPGAFFFDWRVVYTEFIPEEEAISDDMGLVEEAPETLSMDDLQVGERYQLIITPYLNDLTRYLMPDILECVALGDDVINTSLPVFLYHSRCDKLISLHNFTRISEEELIQVLKEADIPFMDFTARREIKGKFDHMKIFIELTEEMPEEEVSERIHEQFLEIDKDWRDLTNFMEYKPLMIQLLPRGSFNEYMDRKGGLPRVDHIEMKKEHLALLLEN